MGWLSVTSGMIRLSAISSSRPELVSDVSTMPPDVVTAMVLNPLNDSVPGTKMLMLE